MIRPILPIAGAILIFGCSGGTAAGTAGQAEVLHRGAATPSEGNTAVERLLQKVKMPPSDRALRDGVYVDSVGSEANSGLMYHWMRVQGRRSHDFEVVAIGSYGGQFFDPADLRGWETLFTMWTPHSPNQALALCSEAVAVGVNHSPNRLRQRDLLELGSALRLVRPSYRDLVSRYYRPPAVELTEGADQHWIVHFWYPNLEQSPYRRRLATKYKCEVPSTLTEEFRVLETDSILLR